MPVFSVQYFGSIYFYYLVQQYPKICIETKEYFVKQTYRNRHYILTANGVMPLIIPLKHHSSKEMIDKKEICYKEKWYKNHYVAILSAYRKSPFFEYYADELLQHLIQPEEKFLFELDMKLMKTILKILGIKTTIEYTSEYKTNYEMDYRNFFDKKLTLPDKLKVPYLQVFSDRFPFQPNLSVLDLIFNLGPDAGEYVRESSD
ncbi:MAG: hypothetical protein KatS3mg027_1626 [Bacteroidia bacterium]|nr:MAG: hypothetical protein KatS3mg027_1626 [Bacteroidia bacterium]